MRIKKFECRGVPLTLQRDLAKAAQGFKKTQKKSFGVVAQLIERYVRIVEVVGLSPISSTTNFCYRAHRARLEKLSAAAEFAMQTKTGIDFEEMKHLSRGICRAIKEKVRGYGGMVDAEDLKSFGHCDRVGSSPTIPTTDFHRRVARAENRVPRICDSKDGQQDHPVAVRRHPSTGGELKKVLDE